MTTSAIGTEGFRWFLGIVEDRDDPLKLGRLKIRIYNVHSENKALVSTKELPWANVLNPIQSASFNKVGISPTGILVGTTVVGFFMDGNDGNQPIVLGTLAGIPGNKQENHDVPKEAREQNPISKPLTGPEPPSAYKAKYPYNKVIRTERGHVIELDDTPDNERIHIYHRSGTYEEVNKQGRKVTKVVDDDFDIVVKNQEVWIGGKLNVYVNGVATCRASRWNIIGDVYVEGSIKASGEITDKTRSMSGDRRIYNSHSHGGGRTPDEKQ